MPSLKTPNTRKSDTAKSRPSFEGTARELGCDETPGVFERAFRKIVPPKRPQPKKAEKEQK